MTRESVDFHPDAVIEGEKANAWYSHQNPAAASAFMVEPDSAISAITEAPFRWRRYLFGTRRYLLRRFPYSVVYRAKPEGILIVAIAHGSRKPGYWKDR